ncbi:hypothetical protein PS914_05903 [Pseudomonas fluorescens]|nr:hypothetical protein PS914_05903 [Pseudomonas fluorescens]
MRSPPPLEGARCQCQSRLDRWRVAIGITSGLAIGSVPCLAVSQSGTLGACFSACPSNRHRIDTKTIHPGAVQWCEWGMDTPMLMCLSFPPLHPSPSLKQAPDDRQQNAPSRRALTVSWSSHVRWMPLRHCRCQRPFVGMQIEVTLELLALQPLVQPTPRRQTICCLLSH